MCPECGAMQSTVDEKVESMVEPSFYHYKNERYAAVVLNRITGEPSHPGIPEYVVQAVVRELVEKQGVRNASDITVGDMAMHSTTSVPTWTVKPFGCASTLRTGRRCGQRL